MGRMSMETRQRVVHLRQSGMKIKDIRTQLQEEGVKVSATSLYILVGKFSKTGKICDLHRASRPRILTQEHYKFVDKVISENDETTTRSLTTKLKENFTEIEVSSHTVGRARRDLGWTQTTPRYCQLIREVNKEKRLKWCKEMKDQQDKFLDVIWTDECSVQIERHSLHCYRKKGQPKRFKPRPKHPLKVHIWAGISCRGATSIVIFNGILVATKLIELYETALIPFIRKVYPEHHRLMQDNDPKHTSKLATKYLENNGIVWWKTPPESPDLNPIENVWGSLKRFLRDKHKPYNMATLIEGIKLFWKTLTPTQCTRYINHIQKVIPKVIEESGGPSGY